MAIISPQRNAILSFEKREELGPPLYFHDEIAFIEGGAVRPVGISKGINSAGPSVLVFSEKGEVLDLSDAETPLWDYAVLLRGPEPLEEINLSRQVGSAALETVELLTGTDDLLCLERTGIAETYTKIY